VRRARDLFFMLDRRSIWRTRCSQHVPFQRVVEPAHDDDAESEKRCQTCHQIDECSDEPLALDLLLRVFSRRR
jgi:hypothetical protein